MLIGQSTDEQGNTSLVLPSGQESSADQQGSTKRRLGHAARPTEVDCVCVRKAAGGERLAVCCEFE